MAFFVIYSVYPYCTSGVCSVPHWSAQLFRFCQCMLGYTLLIGLVSDGILWMKAVEIRQGKGWIVALK